MKRIGIVTLYYNNYNYGGQLQAYAMQRVFTTDCSCARLISFTTNSSKYFIQRLKDLGIKKTIINTLNKGCFNILKLNKQFKNEVELRKKRFNNFMELSPHTKIYNATTIYQCNDEFDQFVCGSDQIWNPGWWNDIYFLNFTDNAKYSYGASIARSNLTNQEIEYIKKNTECYFAISVREKQAQQMLEAHLAKKIELVLDPTLLIDKEEWEKMAVLPSINEKYVLFYMVGDSKGLKRKVYEFCKSKGYRIVSIGFSKNTFFSADVMYSDVVVKDAGPKEWLGWIKSAEYVFTDSFHGSVFSIIFRRQFWCFERDNPNDLSNENSRLYNLLNLTGLTDRLLNYDTNISLEQDKAISFKNIDEKLLPFIEKSKVYIKKCIQEGTHA